MPRPNSTPGRPRSATPPGTEAPHLPSRARCVRPDLPSSVARTHAAGGRAARAPLITLHRARANCRRRRCKDLVMEHTFVISAWPNQQSSDPKATINYVGDCQICGWRGQVWLTYADAEDEAGEHPET